MDQEILMSVSFYASYQEYDDMDRRYIKEVPEVNWSSANARIMLRILDFPENDVLLGSIPLYRARRAFMRANSFIDKRAPQHERTEESGENFIIFGFTSDMIKERLKQFGAFLELASLAGAKSIYWC
jgi:hypothetical protein